jgi:geranylgeranyl diphosphate synthase type I
MKKGLEALKEMTALVDAEIFRTLENRAKGKEAKIYHMLQYFMGYRDEHFAREEGQSGKRFRPSLCLFIADAYGAKEKVLEAAVAIELFHNFTLLHDDVEDRDEYRRGRPTVWKLWGINHAINSGDIQSLVVAEWAMRAGQKAGAEMSTALLESFIEVWEGQFLDFELADDRLNSGDVSESAYLRMIEKKSGVLVRIAAEAAGIAAEKEDERSKLRDYGLYLGMAFQLADDYRSVWSTQEITGKDTHSDIREHKRTLPFIAAYAEATGETHKRLGELYSLDRQLSETEIREALSIMNTTSARAVTLGRMREYSERAKAAARSLDIGGEKQEILVSIVDALVPQEEAVLPVGLPAPVAL